MPEPRIVARCSIYHRDNDEAIAAKPDLDGYVLDREVCGADTEKMPSLQSI